ncbi:MAG: sugar transferase [Chloroflexi bacterium]|nr:MAG: sugar transferase [Chloroflexota bacterium]
MSGVEAPQSHLATAAPLPSDGQHTDMPLPGMRSTALPVNVRRARRQRLETSVLVALDALAIVGGGLLAYWLRYVVQLDFGRELFFYQPLERFGRLILLLLGTTLALLWLKGSYQQPRNAAWLGQLGTLASSTLTAVGLSIILTFLYRPNQFSSRLIFIYAAVLIFGLLALGRLLIVSWRRWQWRAGRDLERVLVVGGTGLGREVMASLSDSAATGYCLVGYVADPPDPDAPAPRFTATTSAPHLGPLAALPMEVARQGIDHIIVALPFWQHKALPTVVLMCTQLGIDFQVVPDFYELSFDRVTIQELRGTPLIGLRENRIKGANYWLKRILDVTLVLLTLPLWGLLALLISVAIKLTSRGPILYTQTRIGRHGHPFEFLKFRTMVVNADELKAELLAQNDGSGPMFKMKHDPRVTPIGRVLRKYSLDEIPQFLNVLRGDISLVGPRPAIPEEVFQYETWHRRRLEVTPGITGLWQATGRSDTSFDEMVRLDIYYAEHWSLWLDVRILLATIPSVLSGRGAY